MTHRSDQAGDDPPFLSTAPPMWAARAVSWLVILLFSGAAVVSLVVRVPETVEGRFVLVPTRGMDPVRVLRRGQVLSVRAHEAESVTVGAPLYVVRSEPAGDRSAELGGLRAQIAGSQAAVGNAQNEYEWLRRADEEEIRTLTARLAAAIRTADSKRAEHQLASARVARYKPGLTTGAISPDEYTVAELDVARLAGALSAAEGERMEAEGQIAKLNNAIAAREAQHRETVRSLVQARTQAEFRAAALDQDVGQSDGSNVIVSAPCTGTVLRLRVRSSGAVVQEGEIVGEMACADDRLQAALALSPASIGRIRPGQDAKLLYDAFPYQRFGVRRGRIRWVSPAASIAAGDSSGFRAFIDLDELRIRVDGQSRALLAGMSGSARVVIDQRPLVSYVFEPIRQLRESMAGVDR